MDNTFLIKLLDQIQCIMCEKKDYLIQLDSIVGDGDLGLTMSDGFVAAYNAVRDSAEADTGKLLYTAGKAMSTAVPSTMGTLMASGLMQAGKELKGKEQLNNEDLLILFKAYEAGVMHRGKAKIGEKTFLDGIDPAIKAFEEALQAGENLKSAAKKAEIAAKEGFENTTTMKAVHGRAATRGEASIKLEDPGAAVAMLLMKAFAEIV